MSARWISLGCLLFAVACSAQRCDTQRDVTPPPSSWVIPKASAGVQPSEPTIDASVSLKQGTEELTWTFDQSPVGRFDVVVVLPDRRENERFPLLIALHGRGEAMKGPVRGARGWVDDYALGRALRRLSSPPLTHEDFEGIVEPSRLNLLNRSLQSRPYQGLVVLCPYTPDLLSGERAFERVQPYARFLVEVVIARAMRELPVINSPDAVGIDGVSLGGRLSVLSGLAFPKAFGAVGSLQAAFDSSEAGRLAALGVAAKKSNPNLKFRFLTSDGDYFLGANHAIDDAFTAAKVDHEFVEVRGPHDYIFNRGPGALEMLLWHAGSLRGQPSR